MKCETKTRAPRSLRKTVHHRVLLRRGSNYASKPQFSLNSAPSKRQFMKSVAKQFYARMFPKFCAVALGIGSCFSRAAASKDLVEPAPAKTLAALPWSHVGAKALCFSTARRGGHARRLVAHVDRHQRSKGPFPRGRCISGPLGKRRCEQSARSIHP